MTISSTTTVNQYTGNNSTTAFAYAFKIYADADLKVILTSTAGVETVQTLSTHYTVSGAGDAGGGNVTFTSGNTPGTGVLVTILRNTAITQSTDYVANDAFPAALHEDALDRLTVIAQHQQDRIDRSIKAPDSEAAGYNMTLPSKDNRKGKYLAFNSTTGMPEAGASSDDVTTLAAVTTDIATLADIEDGTDATDAIQTVAGISSNVTAVAAKASLITSDFVSDLNTVAVSDVITDLNLLATSAIVEDLNILATSDIVSDLNQLATSDFVSDLNAVEGIKANVTTVANTVSSINDFVARYRVGSSDPSDSLDAGDLAYNTSSNVLKYYTGSAWQSIQLTSGISSGNVATFTSGVADNDFLRVDGTSVEGRSASEVLSDIGAQAALTFGISNTNAVKIDSASVADDEYARFTANGLESRSTSEVLSDIGGTTATAAADEATALAIALG